MSNNDTLMGVNDVASIVTLRQLAESQEIAIPDVQRGLVWNPTQIAELWKSIFAGYPIGALTVYREGNTWQLIDGQQRWHAIRLGLNPNYYKSMTSLWTVWKKDGEDWTFVHLMVCTRRHPWGFVWNKEGDKLERMVHKDMVAVWEEMSEQCGLTDSFEIPNMEEAERYLRQSIPYKWVPLHEILAEATPAAGVGHIWASSTAAAWRERVGKYALPLIHFNLQEEETGKSRIHELFTRINKGGTAISNVDYTYSTLCSYLGKAFKERINKIGENFLPVNRIARLYARLCYTLAPKHEKAKSFHEPPHYSYWFGHEFDAGDEKICRAIEEAKEEYSANGIPASVYLSAGGDEWLTLLVWCILRFPEIRGVGVAQRKLLCMLPYIVCREPAYHPEFCRRFYEALKDEKFHPLSLLELMAAGVAYAACYSVETGMYPISLPKNAEVKQEYAYEEEWLHIFCNPKNEPLLHFLQAPYMNRLLRDKCGFYPHETSTWGEAMNRPWDIDHVVPQVKWWCLKQGEHIYRESLANKQLLYYRRNRQKSDRYVGVPSEDGICPVHDFCYPENRLSEDKSHYGIHGVKVWENRPVRLTEKTKMNAETEYSNVLLEYTGVVNARLREMITRLWNELSIGDLIAAINELPYSENVPSCLQLAIKCRQIIRDIEAENEELQWSALRHNRSKQQYIRNKDFYHSLCYGWGIGKVQNGVFKCLCIHQEDADTLYVESGSRRPPELSAEDWRKAAIPQSHRSDWWVEDDSFTATSYRIQELPGMLQQWQNAGWD